MTSPRPLSRRAFLAGTAGAAAVAASPLVRGAASPAPDDPEVLRVGLVGCGGRGTGAALQALRAENGTVVLTALADVFPERIAACRRNLRSWLGEDAGRVAVDAGGEFVGFDAADRLIASDVDVVLLATPPHFRPAHLAAAVAAGKHVFTEKPMAVDAPGVRSVIETAQAADAKGLSLVSGFCWRYNVRHRALFGRVLDGAIGELQTFYSTYNATPLGTHERQVDWSDMEFQLRNWQHFTWLSGDHVVEQAVHSLDKQSWALGDEPPLSCTAVGGRQAREGEARGNVFDHFGVTFDYAGGRKAFHMCRQMSNCSTDNSDFAHGTEGRATVNGWGNVFVIEGARPWEYEGPGNDMYQQEHDELFASIRAGTPRNDGPWMTTSTLLAIMARMAAYTGQTVTWEAALASTERLGPPRYAFGDLPVDPVAVPGRTELV